MNQPINTDELHPLEALRREVLKIAEHFHDAEYQRQNFPTMHSRSNINGVFGEAEAALESIIKTKELQARIEALTELKEYWYNLGFRGEAFDDIQARLTSLRQELK